MTYTYDQLFAAAVLSATHRGRQTVLLSYVDGNWWALPYTGLPAWQVALGELYDGRFTDFRPVGSVDHITATTPKPPHDHPWSDTNESTEEHLPRL